MKRHNRPSRRNARRIKALEQVMNRIAIGLQHSDIPSCLASAARAKNELASLKSRISE